MTANFFVGVDGGASKCMVRVEDEAGYLLGQQISGPASIRISVRDTWQSINTALAQVLQHHGLSLADKNNHFHAGMGLAGCEIKEAYHSFLTHPHMFKTLVVSSDSHTACLGAHKGGDGAIIIAGTGVVGFQLQNQESNRVGGWGFPHDDEGGGAWLGMQAVRATFKWLDGREDESPLARKIFSSFAENKEQLVSWANQANSTMFAELAPTVISQAEAGDELARNIMKQAALAIEKVSDALFSAQINKDKPLPCSLLGGVAIAIEPYLNEALRKRLQVPLLTPDAGAVLLARFAHTRKNND